MEDLKQITSNLNQPNYKNLLVDFKDNDDSGIYKVDESNIIVQSLDFITPIVDDLYIYGGIAAANSLSDVFAKGSDAHTAMSILMWDKEHLNTNEANEILQGALNKLIESSTALLGGHSIVDSEQKFGLSVTGIIKDSIFWRNNTAKIGDLIILTKPIGSGILSSALKAGEMEFSKDLDFVKSMLELNLYAKNEAKKFSISACSDVTGFGLIGHLNEMINQSISINLYANEVAMFDRVREFANIGIIPGGSHKNKATLESSVLNENSIDDIFFYDAQTSGGLLIALDSSNTNELNKILNDKGIQSKIIAECVPKSEYKIYLKK
ncbi:MAG: selenide, water dikinase SelD [Helicobacteraceae bacterium]|nr:selenide, water dikinase SelD [Helicobacteraceae bacterium]